MQSKGWSAVARDFGKGLLEPALTAPAQLTMPSECRYAVYRNNVTVGLVNALGANFPAMRRLLGPVYFDGFAREFAWLSPPDSPLLFEYGAAFPEYIRQAPDLASFPYLSEVAQLEFQWLQSYHAADAPCVNSGELAAVKSDQLPDLRFMRHPAAHLFTSPYAAGTIMMGNRQSGPVPPIEVNRQEFIVITRPAFEVGLTFLETGAYHFFAALFAGQALASAAEHAAAADPDFDLQRALQTALSTGAFASMKEINP